MTKWKKPTSAMEQRRVNITRSAGILAALASVRRRRQTYLESDRTDRLSCLRLVPDLCALRAQINLPRPRVKQRGSQPGRLWKAPSLPKGAYMNLYFREGCDEDSSGRGESVGRIPVRNARMFRRAFQLRRSTFMFVLRRIRKHLSSDIARFAPKARNPVLPREALAMTLSRLGTKGESFRTAEHFGRGGSTVRRWMPIVMTAIRREFDAETIKIPDTAETLALCKQAEILRGFPQNAFEADGKVARFRSLRYISGCDLLPNLSLCQRGWCDG